jgi:hypothetical protein
MIHFEYSHDKQWVRLYVNDVKRFEYHVDANNSVLSEINSQLKTLFTKQEVTLEDI